MVEIGDHMNFIITSFFDQCIVVELSSKVSIKSIVPALKLETSFKNGTVFEDGIQFDAGAVFKLVLSLKLVPFSRLVPSLRLVPAGHWRHIHGRNWGRYQFCHQVSFDKMYY